MISSGRRRMNLHAARRRHDPRLQASGSTRSATWTGHTWRTSPRRPRGRHVAPPAGSMLSSPVEVGRRHAADAAGVDRNGLSLRGAASEERGENDERCGDQGSHKPPPGLGSRVRRTQRPTTQRRATESRRGAERLASLAHRWMDGFWKPAFGRNRGANSQNPADQTPHHDRLIGCRGTGLGWISP